MSKLDWSRSKRQAQRQADAAARTRPPITARPSRGLGKIPAYRIEVEARQEGADRQALRRWQFFLKATTWISYAYDEQASRRMLTELEQAGWQGKAVKLPEPDAVSPNTGGVPDARSRDDRPEC